VRSKLKTFHLKEELEEKILNKLIREDFLNEERYARLFAGGKFRINQWGKNKIYAHLLEDGVPELFILEGLNEIDQEDYITVLRTIISKKSREVNEKNYDRKIRKLADFAIGRGFEPNLVWDVLNYRD
jgi:regulatory protein